MTASTANVGWLPGPDGAPLQWADVTAAFPEPVAALIELHQAVWDHTDPVLLELCRLRMATLLSYVPGLQLRSPKAKAAGLTEDKIARLAQWPTSSLFNACERASLALAEQMLMDTAGTTDEQVADLLHYLDPAACYRLVQGISAMESLARLGLVLGLSHSPEETWLEPITPSDTGDPP